MKKFKILYEDKYLIAVDKPSGMLSISDGNYNNLYSYVREYVKKQNPKNKIFIVHRLDKDTSGVIIFAKNAKVKNILQNNWNTLCLNREYLCIVHGNLKKKKDKLINFIMEDKTLKCYITNNKVLGKKAITNYEVIKSNSKYSVLKVRIETGRKNQIRLQLCNIGNPILGDKKYGIKDGKKRLYLHASILEIKHPITNEILKVEATIPKEMNMVIKHV